MQLSKGAKVKKGRLSNNLTQPIQFLPRKDKDEDWAAQNMDWFEAQGIKQIKQSARRLLKNYKLAAGIIDKTDYLVEEDNEMADLIDVLTKEDESALELKFFPIIPNVINVLTGEFTKRNDKITYRATDDLSYNEMLSDKMGQIEQYLVQQAEMKMLETATQMGLAEDSEEFQQMLSPENIRSLPEIEQFFKKDYRSMVEQWALHQHNADEERFKLRELEATAFRDMLISDREFWHFKMNEDDYDLELWNPVLTFYHKSPDVRYVSQGNYVGKIDLMTVADVIDKFGYKMTERQLLSLQEIYPVQNLNYIMPKTLGNDGGYYDASKSHKWNTDVESGPSLAMRQWMSAGDSRHGGDDILKWILSESEDSLPFGADGLLRVSTIYWKSQRKVGHLTRILDDGMPLEMIVDEGFRLTVKPIYDESVMRGKHRENLVYGEHVDWIWINQVWGGEKIGLSGPSYPSTYDHKNDSFQPIYLDVNPIKFQFKGDHSLYGCKLPVEGSVFSDRNTKSTSLVDKMKPYQVGFNMVNNQIADILIDELGTIIALDQNALPRHSMGEDWGKANFGKAYVAMKNFSMLPLDTTLSNMENATQFSHYQVLNLEQTNRLLSRVQLAEYFKRQAFESIGITQERMGAVNGQATATGVEQGMKMSYAQTETYFTQHSEYLMPRVHQMRTDLAQYYHSHKPSVRLSYVTTLDEQVNFEMNGTDLLMRDINLFVSTKVNTREIAEKMRQLALENNTAGASIYDLGNLIKADGLAEIDHVLKANEEKAERQRQEEMAAMQEQEKMRQEGETQRLQMAQAFEAEQNQLDRDKDLEEARIRASVNQIGDQNNNGQSDYMDAIQFLDKRQGEQAKLNLNREKEVNRQAETQQKMQLSREELATRKEIADKQLQIARENKNQYDAKSKKKK
jgi:hypothetical protein